LPPEPGANATFARDHEYTCKPLRMWFLAMWFVTSQKNGVSALGLQRELGLGSYETFTVDSDVRELIRNQDRIDKPALLVVDGVGIR